MPRFAKQLLILLILFSIIGGALYLVYVLKKEPTCSDGIQNQNEEGIDCGGICPLSCLEKRAQPLNVEQIKLIKVKDFDYDLLVELSNPNFDFGASRIDYTIEFTIAFDTFTKLGVAYIAPGDTRYIIESPLTSYSEISDVKFEIDKVIWTEPKIFLDMTPDQLFTVRNMSFDREGSKLSAILFNNSDFNFDSVDINVILFSDSGITWINKTQIKTFLARETRHFEVFWPDITFEKEPSNIIVEVNTNILYDSNFLKLIRTPEIFQQ